MLQIQLILLSVGWVSQTWSTALFSISNLEKTFPCYQIFLQLWGYSLIHRNQSCNQYLSTCFSMMLGLYRYNDGKDFLDYSWEYLSAVSWSVDWYMIICCRWILQSHFGDQFWLVTLLIQIMTQGTSRLDFHQTDSQCYLLCLIPSQQYHYLICYLEVRKSYSYMYIHIYTIENSPKLFSTCKLKRINSYIHKLTTEVYH